ncbi:MAG: SH3 domain-containing protein [Balneolaceae bacterium]
MRKLFCILFFPMLSIFWVDANGQQTRFDEANSLLENGEYSHAIDTYKSISRDGYESGALWLNLGISYVQLDSLGMAKYSFLKANEFPETSERATTALDYVNDRFPRQSAVLPQLPWIRFLNSVKQAIGITALTLMALFFLYTGTALIIGSWFRADLRRFFRIGSYISLGISVILFILISIITYRADRYDTAVMVDRQEAVYQQPSENSPVISTAYEGYTMQVDHKESEPKDGWYSIRLENGMYGWIKNETLKIL